MTKEQALLHWRVAIEYINENAYLDIDTPEIDLDIAARGEVEEFIDDYTDAERDEIAALDARFKQSLWRMLRKSKHEQWYREAGKHFPDAWWWHVPSPFDSTQGDAS